MTAEFCETMSFDGKYHDTPTMMLALGEEAVYRVQRGMSRQERMQRAAGIALIQTNYRFLRLPLELLPEAPGKTF